VEGLGLMLTLPNRAFWQNKRVLLTGHTGFKGGWLALWLNSMGAHVSGLSLPPDTAPNFYTIARVARTVADGFGDLRVPRDVTAAVQISSPEVVIHLAAQPLVLESLRDPVATFATNLMGTVNLLNALRDEPNLRVILIVTTDKVYRNTNSGQPFREHDPLGAQDPYSASKSAAELATQAYARAFFESRGVAVATARAGNVIGGGDFAIDRIIPDVYRSTKSGEQLVLRHPHATRPWQHVLDCLSGYLVYIEYLAQRSDIPRSLNFGPSEGASVSVANLVEAMQIALGEEPQWCVAREDATLEMKSLELDSTLARQTLGWSNGLMTAVAINVTAQWYLAFSHGQEMDAYSIASIQEYLRLLR
jgi:CDP-glucose 4,6-dehydratase